MNEENIIVIIIFLIVIYIISVFAIVSCNYIKTKKEEDEIL